MFYLTLHSTHFYLRLYDVGHMVKDHSDREKTHCCPYMRYSFWLATRVLLYGTSQRRDNTYHGFCYTSRGELNGGSIRRPIAA